MSSKIKTQKSIVPNSILLVFRMEA